MRFRNGSPPPLRYPTIASTSSLDGRPPPQNTPAPCGLTSYGGIILSDSVKAKSDDEESCQLILVALEGTEGTTASEDETSEVKADERSSSALSAKRLPEINSFQHDCPDPFHSLGRPITAMDAHLIKEYSKHRYPWYQNVQSKARFQASRDLFLPHNATDALVIDVMVAYGSMSLAGRNASSRTRSIALESICRAVRGIRGRIEVESKSPSVGLLIAVTGTICSSTETGDHPIDLNVKSQQIKSHVNGLRNLIISYGGWPSITANCFHLAWLILWVDMQLKGIILNGLTQIPTPLPEKVDSPDNLPPPSPWPLISNIPTAYTELVCMYARFHLVATFRWMFPTSFTHPSPILEPLWLFQPLTTVYQTLRSPHTFSVSRLIPLLYINIILEKASKLPSSAKSCLYEMYQHNLADTDFEAIPSCELLMWGLMTDTRKLCFTDLEALECMNRLSWATKDLKPEDREKLSDTLCDFILLFQREAVIGRKDWWTPQQFEDVMLATAAASEA